MDNKQWREKLASLIVNLPPSVIAIADGCGAHHWARRRSQLVHDVRLAAIFKAARRPTMRFVTALSVE